MIRRSDVSPRLQAMMGGLLIGLVVLNGWILSRVVDTTPVAPPPVSRATGDALLAVQSTEAVPSAERGGDTVARVLFHPTRRPARVESAPVAAAEHVSDGELKLVGILNNPQRGWRALIRQDALADWYGAGDTVGAWRVVTVERERAVLEGRGRRIELALYGN